MTAPVLVSCPVNVWTKIATAITQGIFHIKKLDATYYITEVDTAGGAPTLAPELITSTALPMAAESQFVKSASSDVYVFCRKNAGVVRVGV